MPKTKTAPKKSAPKKSTHVDEHKDAHDPTGHDHAHDHNHDHNHGAPAASDAVPQSSFVSENIKFKLTAPWAEIQKSYQIALDSLVKDAEVDGFRKGKAPRALVEEKIGKSKIYEATIDLVLPKLYSAAVHEKKLQPIVAPHIHPISLDENKDWVFEVETAEAPEMKLGDYKDAVKTVRAKNALWTPGKDLGKDQKGEQPSEEERLKQIFGALLEHIHVVVPEILIRDEVNQSLSQLVRQLEKMRIPLEDYLTSVSKTADQLRQEYAMSSLATLQLEFIISTIAAQENIGVEEKQVDEVIQALPDENIRKANNTPQQRNNIKANLIKRKTVDYLLAL